MMTDAVLIKYDKPIDKKIKNDLNDTHIYLALTGDVIQSRNTCEDDFVHLKKCLTEFNKKFHPVVPFAIQAGDEIQGLLRCNSQPVALILWLLAKVYPMKIRWGIGEGKIETPLQKLTSEMRGEAFEWSRKALQEAKRNKQALSYYSPKSNAKQINIIFRLLAGHLEDWNEMTFRRYLLYSESKTIYRVAQAEGVSPEAVNKHLNRKKIRLVLDSVNYLDDTIF